MKSAVKIGRHFIQRQQPFSHLRLLILQFPDLCLVGFDHCVAIRAQNPVKDLLDLGVGDLNPLLDGLGVFAMVGREVFPCRFHEATHHIDQLGRWGQIIQHRLEMLMHHLAANGFFAFGAIRSTAEVVGIAFRAPRRPACGHGTFAAMAQHEPPQREIQMDVAALGCVGLHLQPLLNFVVGLHGDQRFVMAGAQ